MNESKPSSVFIGKGPHMSVWIISKAFVHLFMFFNLFHISFNLPLEMWSKR
jgi:hypothetical protein